MHKVNIKPLSVNEAWQGRRFKTQQYKRYERDLLMLLPKIEIPPGDLQVTFTVGYSNANADIDNFVKPTVDVMQKRYGFNDRRITRLVIDKVIVPRGMEYFSFEVDQRPSFTQ